MDDFESFEVVYAFVRTVPAGKVVTYGQIAEEIATVRLTARMVGTAMRYAPVDVPWQRVVGAEGSLPIAKRSPEMYRVQRDLLEKEGVAFLSQDSPRVDMRRCQWHYLEPSQGNLFDE